MSFDYKRLFKFELNLDETKKKYRLYAGRRRLSLHS